MGNNLSKLLIMILKALYTLRFQKYLNNPYTLLYQSIYFFYKMFFHINGYRNTHTYIHDGLIYTNIDRCVHINIYLKVFYLNLMHTGTIDR